MLQTGQKLFQNTLQSINNTPKIIGFALNYGKRTEASPKDPVFFVKTLNCLTTNNQFQTNSKNQFNHELELGFVISKQAKNVEKNFQDYIGGYFLCQDITDANFIAEMRQKQYSWELSKCQDQTLPIGEFIENDIIGNPFEGLELEMKVNDDLIYKESTNNMLFNIEEQIKYVSQFMTLNPGDLFLTGTPKPAPFKKNDELKGNLIKNNKIISSLNVKAL